MGQIGLDMMRLREQSSSKFDCGSSSSKSMKSSGLKVAIESSSSSSCRGVQVNVTSAVSNDIIDIVVVVITDSAVVAIIGQREVDEVDESRLFA